MFAQDILMRELMQFVQQILTKVAGWLNINKVSEAHQLTDSTAEKALGLSLEDLLEIDASKWKDFIEEKEWHELKIQIAAELFLTKAKIWNAEDKELEANQYLEKSEFLFLYLLENGKEYSLEWKHKLTEIEILKK